MRDTRPSACAVDFSNLASTSTGPPTDLSGVSRRMRPGNLAHAAGVAANETRGTVFMSNLVRPTAHATLPYRQRSHGANFLSRPRDCLTPTPQHSRCANARRQRTGPRNGGHDLDADWRGAVPVRCTPWLGLLWPLGVPYVVPQGQRGYKTVVGLGRGHTRKAKWEPRQELSDSINDNV
jgi:hypothetical protein